MSCVESVLSTNLGMSMSILNSNTLPKTVEIYDTTLRDGAQLEGISLTVDDKLRIAEQLDSLGVHYIECVVGSFVWQVLSQEKC